MKRRMLVNSLIREASEIEGDRGIIKEMEAIQAANESGGVRPI